MEFLNSQQKSFFDQLNNRNFSNRVLSLQDAMGMDGAFYFSLGEMQSETDNDSFDDLSDDSQDLFLSALIEKFPELEF